MELPTIGNNEAIGLDYESTGLKYWEPDFRVFGVGVSTTTHRWYWDIRKHPGVVNWLADTLPRVKKVVAHHAQFDYQCTRVLKIDPRKIRNWQCTMVTDCLIDEHQLTYDLQHVAERYRLDPQKAAHLERIRVAMGWTGTAEVLARLSEVPDDLVSYYGSDDAWLALKISEHQEYYLGADELERVYALEMNLLPVLADMSWHGIRVNLEAAHAAIPKLTDKIETLQYDINQIVGKKFNVNSTPQIREYFKPTPVNKYQYQLVDGTIVGQTKKGKGPCLDQNAMRQIKDPLAKKILDLRKTIKLRDVFVKGHVIGSADSEGYVHTSFNQTRNDADAGTVTGRLSSTDPALQQITKRDKENSAILRSLFIADEGHEWGCYDHSQIDFRCSAHLINDPNIIQAYWADPKLDFHQIVSDMTGIPRNAPYAGAPYTKQINLGLAFGAGSGKLAFMMGMPYTVGTYRGKMTYYPGPEAKAVFEKYHSMLPGVKVFMKHAENVAKEYGYVKTMIGRRLRHQGHKSAGLLYQAYAADIHKFGLVRVDALIRRENLPVRLMMSCHDEIGISGKYDEEVHKKILHKYTDYNSDNSPIKMRIPITASGKYGPNWYEASKD